MTVELSLEEIGIRLIELEKLVARLLPQEFGPAINPLQSNGDDFIYTLSLDDEEVWRGHSLEAQLIEVTQANPGRLVTVSWDYVPDVLVI